jgi:sulfur relay (sulfurtransferase) complex TusBCD TusD component (DsrE family)
MTLFFIKKYQAIFIVLAWVVKLIVEAEVHLKGCIYCAAGRGVIEELGPHHIE